MKSSNLKNNHIRYAEYDGMVEKLDKLYSSSQQGANFRNLMSIIESEENILLAYRTIKRNKGSTTAGIDGLTIKDVQILSQEIFLTTVKQRFACYRPRKVKRVEIPKPNGEKRPLGIPSIWDRIAQQCILQVLEPICEAKFYTHSYGFRPHRSAENAIASCMKRINTGHMQYVVDIDIKSFFDEVNHTKLMRQLWTMGIRDKNFLVIVRKMLKAPIVLPNGAIQFPSKGTPQGGVLSPLLANIYLNEFDWWISNQWEQRTCKEIKPQWSRNGTRHRGNDYRKLRKSTCLKEVHLVRYADDFKLFTYSKESANKVFLASKMWLQERLKLSISEEKSKITNLRKKSSDFLGFTLQMKPKSKKIICVTHVAPKSIKKMKQQLTDQIKEIQRQPNSEQTIRAIKRYNRMVVGIHNYYRIATAVSVDLSKVQYQMLLAMYNRLHSLGLLKKTTYLTKDESIQRYLKSKMVRFLKGYPIIPIGYIKTKNAQHKSAKINRYTTEGRQGVHHYQQVVPDWKLEWLRSHYVSDKRSSVEFNDNRLSLFVAQNGKCAVTGEELDLYNMHCHYKVAYSQSQDDSYVNLVIIKKEIYLLVHAIQETTITKLLAQLRLSKEELEKVNVLREKLDRQPLYSITNV